MPGTTSDVAEFGGALIDGEGPDDGQGTDLDTESEFDAETDSVVGSGVAREVAVPRTPAKVASPSVAAADADDTLSHQPAVQVLRSLRIAHAAW